MPQNKHKRKLGIDTPQLPGWPGYRNRSNRSGLDPIDNSREEAFMEGMFIRRLFKLQLRTRVPYHLFLMFLLGAGLLALAVPFLFDVLSNLTSGNPRDMFYGLVSFIFVVGLPLSFGVALMINFWINIRRIWGMHPTSDNRSKHEIANSPEKPKKRLPKRRKDYH